MGSGMVSADLYIYGKMWVPPVIHVSDMLSHQGVMLPPNNLFARNLMQNPDLYTALFSPIPLLMGLRIGINLLNNFILGISYDVKNSCCK